MISFCLFSTSCSSINSSSDDHGHADRIIRIWQRISCLSDERKKKNERYAFAKNESVCIQLYFTNWEDRYVSRGKVPPLTIQIGPWLLPRAFRAAFRLSLFRLTFGTIWCTHSSFVSVLHAFRQSLSNLLVVHVHSLYGDDFTIAIRLKVRVLWHFYLQITAHGQT